LEADIFIEEDDDDLNDETFGSSTSSKAKFDEKGVELVLFSSPTVTLPLSD
jgi:hypothetical protein